MRVLPQTLADELVRDLAVATGLRVREMVDRFAGDVAHRHIGITAANAAHLALHRLGMLHALDRIKQQHSLPIYEPRREDDVFRNVITNNPGPLPGEAVKRVFERIIDEMRTVQRDKMRGADG